MAFRAGNPISEVWYPTGIKSQNIVDSEEGENSWIQYVFITTGSPMIWPAAAPNTTVITLIENRQISVPCNFEPIMFPFDTHNCEFGFSNEAKQRILLVISPIVTHQVILRHSRNLDSQLHNY